AARAGAAAAGAGAVDSRVGVLPPCGAGRVVGGVGRGSVTGGAMAGGGGSAVGPGRSPLGVRSTTVRSGMGAACVPAGRDGPPAEGVGPDCWLAAASSAAGDQGPSGVIPGSTPLTRSAATARAATVLSTVQERPETRARGRRPRGARLQAARNPSGPPASPLAGCSPVSPAAVTSGPFALVDDLTGPADGCFGGSVTGLTSPLSTSLLADRSPCRPIPGTAELSEVGSYRDVTARSSPSWNIHPVFAVRSPPGRVKAVAPRLCGSRSGSASTWLGQLSPLPGRMESGRNSSADWAPDFLHRCNG
ncbi:hypothetical protein FrEUN1fDRAFT_7243, partial [Parafrankia sp. EUN1f]